MSSLIAQPLASGPTDRNRRGQNVEGSDAAAALGEGDNGAFGANTTAKFVRATLALGRCARFLLTSECRFRVLARHGHAATI